MEPEKKLEHAPDQEAETIVLPPLSPISSALAYSNFLSLSIIPVFVFEVPIHESQVIELLRNAVVPFNQRLSSVLHTDKKGVSRWKKVDFKIEDHVVAVTFSACSSPEEFEQQLRDYVSKVGSEGFQDYKENRPLWEVHVINYPESINIASNNNINGSSGGGGGAVVFKLSHVIGDGYSFLSLMMNTFRRADDPSLPFTYPGVSQQRNNNNSVCVDCWRFMLKYLKTIPNAVRIQSKAMCWRDQRSVARSGNPGLEMQPMVFSSLTFSLDKVKQVKSNVKATVNDVITGMIHYAIHLYMLKKGSDSSCKRMTTLAMLNLRMLRGFKNIDEMMKAGIWGNRSIYLQVPIPPFHPHQKVDPLDFIFKAKKNMKKMKDSMVPRLAFPVLKIIKRIKGTEGVVEYIYSTMKNTTAFITNVIGPNEEMTMAGYPITDFYYILSGIPQSLTFTVVSWMGKLRVAITTEKGFIDSQLFILCMEEAFQKIFEAAQHK